MLLRLMYSRLVRQEDAQNSLEYMLILGAVAVAMMAALITGFPFVVHAVASLACPSIDTAAPTLNGIAAYGACLT